MGQFSVQFNSDTAWSYPLIAQVISYVESFVNLRERVLDVSDAFDAILHLLNDSLSFISDSVNRDMETPDCSFLFCGFSARRQDYFIRRIVFHLDRGKFEGRPAGSVGGEFFTIIGDKRPMSAVVRHIHAGLKQVGASTKTTKLGMLPAHAFFEILSSNTFAEIGGAPQVAKIYQNMSQAHLGVYWPPELPTNEQKIYLRGRRLKDLEALDHPWVYDPSDAKIYWHDFSPDALRERAKL